MDMIAQGPNEKLGVAVIGCGQWGPNHIRNFVGHKQTQVLYCVDLDPKRLERARDLFPSVEATNDLQRALNDERVKAVVIATPTATHFDLAKKALLAGKHVLCEKPLAASAADAGELVALAKQTGSVLMVGHVFLFNAGIVKLRDLIVSGELGRLYYLHATRTNLGPIRQDVDCVWDLATHDISIFNYLQGRLPLEVSAHGTNYLQDGKADVAFITLTYPDQVLGNIHVSWLDPKKVRQLTVVGDKKMITWDDMAPGAPITIYDKGVVREPFYKDFGEFQLVTKEGDIVIPKVRASEPLCVQTDYFISCVRAGSIDLCGPSDGLEVVRVLEAIGKSMAANGAPVPLPP
jgi:predicted dehydrogenase